MIGEFEIEEAIKDSAIDATRYAETAEAAEKPYRRAAAGGFLLGFELGVRAALLERAGL